MPSQLYVPLDARLDVGDTLALDADQHHYLTRVLRFKSGDEVTCFDGQGLKFQARLQSERKFSQLQVTSLDARVAPALPANRIAMALLKGSAMDRAIQLACESGADEICLFQADRSNAKLEETRLENKVRHWQKIIVGACEQSGRLYLPAFKPQANLDELLASQTNTYVLQMDGGPFNVLEGADRLLLIGPEGGWSEDELVRFNAARAQRVSVGPNTLRAESAPGAALAILSYLDSV